MARPRRKFWRICGGCLRWTTRLFVLVLLLLLGSFVFLNRVGLPDFIKDSLLAKLRAHGVALDFSSLRFDGFRIVGENLTMLQTQRTGGPFFSVKEAEVRLDLEALKRFELEPRSLVIQGARMDWPLRQANGDQHTLTVEDIMTELRFLPNDQWELDHFQAKWLGGRITLVGTVKNPALLRSWKFSSGNRMNSVWQQKLSEVLAKLEEIRFKDTPGVRVKFFADGRDPKSIAGELTLGVSAAKTTWGTLEQLSLVCRWTPLESPDATNASVNLDLAADSFRSSWGYIKNGSLAINSTIPLGNAVPTNVNWRLSARRVDTKWAKADSLKLAGQTQRLGGDFAESTTLDALGARLSTTLEAKADRLETHRPRRPMVHWRRPSSTASLINSRPKLIFP